MNQSVEDELEFAYRQYTVATDYLLGRESRQVVWAARFEALALRIGPIVRHVGEDIRAVRNFIRAKRITRGWR